MEAPCRTYLFQSTAEVALLLRTFGVTQKVQLLFYHAAVESLLRYEISARFGNLTVQLIAQNNRLNETALRITGVSQHPNLQDIFQQTMVR